MTIGMLPPLAAEARIVGNGDMNGDGSADLLHLNGDTGELGVWLIAGGAVIGGGAIAELAQDWNVVGNADHDADGRADILLHDATTGELELWTMNGPEIMQAGPLSHAQARGMADRRHGGLRRRRASRPALARRGCGADRHLADERAHARGEPRGHHRP